LSQPIAYHGLTFFAKMAGHGFVAGLPGLNNDIFDHLLWKSNRQFKGLVTKINPE
jgi:hypothetical protein